MLTVENISDESVSQFESALKDGFGVELVFLSRQEPNDGYFILVSSKDNNLGHGEVPILDNFNGIEPWTDMLTYNMDSGTDMVWYISKVNKISTSMTHRKKTILCYISHGVRLGTGMESPICFRTSIPDFSSLEELKMKIQIAGKDQTAAQNG